MSFIEKIQNLKKDMKTKRREAELQEIEDTEHKIKLLEARQKLTDKKLELEEKKQKINEKRTKTIEKGGLFGLGGLINQDALEMKKPKKNNKKEEFTW